MVFRKILYNQIAALFLLGAFMAQTFSRQILIADYYAHMDQYVLHCENKSRPMMHCNGRCQMMKKMQQEDKKDQQDPERRAENKNEVPLSSKSYFASLDSRPFIEVSKKAIFTSATVLPTPRSEDIFHPPTA